ncbi:MAG: hypothetical protein HY706_11580 [Candidatus Hydrogenedentes bacterium]|nr:hypothetical protein [Candidatus Hydrogenedentota bacterium]
MSALALVYDLERHGATFRVEAGKLIVRAPKQAFTEAVIRDLRAHKPRLLAYLKDGDQRVTLAEYLDLVKSDAVLNSQDLPPVPPRWITDQGGPERAQAWSAWWDAVEAQRRRGVIGRPRA